MSIRYPAARRCVETILTNSNVRLPMTETMLDAATRVVITFVEMDEQRQRTEKILGKATDAAP